MRLKLFRDRSGATAIEYALIAALIAIVAITGAALIAPSLNDVFQTLENAFGGVDTLDQGSSSTSQ